MRILVTGSSSATKLGIHLLRKTNLQWHVITSFQTSCRDWENSPNVHKVLQNSHLSDTDVIDPDQPLVIEVIALSFFERSWVKEYLQTAKNLIVIVSSPIHFMDKTLLSTFDRLLINKTLSPEKQSQYYTLFVDTKSMTNTEFKKIIKALDEKQYVEIKSGLVNVIQWVDPCDKKIDDLSVDKTTNIPLKGLVPAIKKEPDLQVLPSDYCLSNSSPVKKVGEEEKVGKSSVDTVSKEKIGVEGKTFESKVVKSKSITGTPVPDNVSELWITFTPTGENPQDLTSLEMDECISSFEEMVSNDLIISMFSTTCKKRTKNNVEFYFHVYKQRQDLFVALMMNILQSLRAGNLITTGSVMI
jgi:hypothetical protein